MGHAPAVVTHTHVVVHRPRRRPQGGFASVVAGAIVVTVGAVVAGFALFGGFAFGRGVAGVQGRIQPGAGLQAHHGCESGAGDLLAVGVGNEQRG